MGVPRILLKPGREEPVQRQHPWVFSGAIREVQGEPALGALVSVRAHDGEFLAWGHYSPHSQIRVRLVAWDEGIDPEAEAFWRARFERAIAARAPILTDGRTTACRLIHAESDGVPGLVVDCYGDTLVLQALSAGAERRREQFTDLLWTLLAPGTIYERSDADVREKEGLPLRKGTLRGHPPPALVPIRENEMTFLVDVREGHKTGFYLDQQENRARLRALIAARVRAGRRPTLLNAFAYTGGFGVYGLRAGAVSLINIDSSEEALALGRENLARNGLADAEVEDVADDAFEALRTLREAGRRFDVIVLDPPKFAHTRRDVRRATRGYKDINLQAFHLLKPGGLLFTFSCSGVVSTELFQKVVFGAALDAGRAAQIIGRLTQSSDHPVALTFPEGEYLKGLICRV
ncbi:MAG: class I SAM-dependent rRNA methyltransferase [Anaerolineae bacterium]